MTSTIDDTFMLAVIEPFREAGFALHWLHEREKRPVGKEWSEAPVATLAQLRATHKPGYNLGVRLGEPSHVCGYYLHTFDIDIRKPDQVDDAWEALAAMLPDIDPRTLPCVASGSGGESRHLHFLTDKPFSSKTLAVSEGKHRRFDTKKQRDVWSYDWEIELFGTGKQVVMPPSIHPDTGKPYIWLREFDFDALLLGDGPIIPSSVISELATAEHETFDFEAREPLTFTARQLERTLADIPDEKIDDYHDWVMLGQALHHQFGASEEGFNLWVEHSKRSDKFDANEIRSMRKKWRGFGRNRKRPVTMATIVEWAQDARVAALRDSFDAADDEDDFSAAPTPAPAKPAASAPAASSFDDLLGGGDDLDALGGGDDDDEEEIDDIDLLGGGREDTESFASLVDSRTDWISLFDLNEEGAIKPTLHNVTLMLQNDPRLAGLPQLNEFTHEVMQRTAPGVKPPRHRAQAKPTRQLTGRIWEVSDTLNGELWSEDRDFAIRLILEAPKTQGGYGIKVTDRDLKAAVSVAANDHCFHPVREYLSATQWDGTPRVDTLFRDYVGAPDDPYTRSVSRLMMVAAVTRIFEPGHKFDFAVILEGLQGKRKSTFIQTLGRSWFAELDGDFHDQKQMVELMQGAWIMEIPELSGFNRGDVRTIKAFISRQKDRARMAYARRAGSFPRQNIFIGSTNDREYLKDDTGGRRFWPMMCEVDEIDIERLETNVDQLWAEAVTIYHSMRDAKPVGTLPLFLTDPEAKTIAARLQESRRVESADDGWAGRIAEWLDAPVVSGSIDDDVDSNGQRRYRQETCLMEIWHDCLGNPSKYQTTDGAMLARVMAKIPGWKSDGRQARFKPWGKQRVYYRER